MNTRLKSLLASYFILFLDNFGYAMIFPILPILLLHPEFHILPHNMSESTRNIYLGLLLAAFPLSQFFGAPFFGDLADRWGRKQALVWTICGCILGYFLTALAIKWNHYILIMLSRIIAGFFSGNLAICMAIVVDLNLDKKKRQKGMSYVGTCLGVGWILAILAATFFTNPKNLHTFHPAFPFVLVGLLSLVSLVILFVFYHETGQAKKEGHRLSVLKAMHNIFAVLDHKNLRTIYFNLFFWFLGFAISLQWASPLSIEKYHETAAHIQWFFVALGIFWTLSSTFLNPWLSSIFSLWMLTLFSLLIIGLLYFFSAIATVFLFFSIAYIISSAFAAMTWTNSMSLISLASKPETQGTSIGIAQSVLSFAQFLGPLFGGMIAGYSIKILFYVCALFIFMSFFLLLIYILKHKETKQL